MKSKKAKKARLAKARIWYSQQHFTKDSDVIEAYQEKFGMPRSRAMKELYQLHMLSPEMRKMYEEKLEKRKQQRKQQKAEKKLKKAQALKKNTRKERLAEARIWYPQQHFTKDSHVVKAYRLKFGVDRICAMKELCMLHMLDPEKQKSYEQYLASWKKKFKKKKKEEYENDWSDDQFYFIAGYTSGGAPYGITWEEEEEIEKREAFYAALPFEMYENMDADYDDRDDYDEDEEVFED